MITQLDLLPSLQPSQDWIRTQLIDGLINPLIWDKVRRGAAARDGCGVPRKVLEGRETETGQTVEGGCSTWARKVGCQRKGTDSPPFSPSTEHLGWDLPGVSETAAPPILLECSIVNPRAVVRSPGYPLGFPGVLLTLSVPKGHPSPVQSKPLGMGPSYQISR